jgi:hypothetical protein
MRFATLMTTTMTVSGLLLLTSAACGARDGAAAATGAAETPAAKEAAKAPAHPVTDSYDATRAGLAADDVDKAKAAAAGLAKAAEAEAAKAQGAAKAPIEAVAAQAKRVAEAANISEARLAFGEMSKAFIGWVDAEPTVGQGLYAFMCPMAKGYKKWVEQQNKMANPYMGKSMLECGGPTEMKP